MTLRRAFVALGALCLVMAVGPTRRVSAQPPVAVDEPSPVRDGPSMRETGRVAKTGLADSGVHIRDARPDRGVPREIPVARAVPPAERPTAAVPSGQIDGDLLARQIRSRFAALGECPAEVARHTHVAASTAASGKFKLRWTILPTGRVADTAVVAASPVNIRVMDCVKRQMSVWSFTPPEGGSVRVERPFRFAGR